MMIVDRKIDCSIFATPRVSCIELPTALEMGANYRQELFLRQSPALNAADD
jgi:hypothetical protein